MKNLKLDILARKIIYGNESIVLTPPPVRKIRGERYESLPLYDKDASGWRSGRKLLACQAHECTFPGALLPGSVRVRQNGKWMQPGRDFLVNDHWGTVGRVPGGGLLPEEQVTISYSFYPSRIDALVIDITGKTVLKIGKEGMAHPEIPAISSGKNLLANICWHGDYSTFSEDMIYPVTETGFPADLLPVTSVPEKTLQKLRNGETVKILAWGDSVTECSYLPEKCRWQEQFRQRLQNIYPQAKIELLTEAWGGRTTSDYFAVKAGEEHHFGEKVLAVRPDLIISEFVNDCGLPEEVFKENYRKIKEAFDLIRAEWIILTPHYTTPAWMDLQNSKNCDDDPRALVKFLRDFARKNQIPLADASCYWGRLYRQGIPYEMLFSNGINHPLEYGLSLFADALLNLFQPDKK